MLTTHSIASAMAVSAPLPKTEEAGGLKVFLFVLAGGEKGICCTFSNGSTL